MSLYCFNSILHDINLETNKPSRWFYTFKPSTKMDQFYELETVTEMLQSGKLLLYPTDTIWGIGCDATNSDSIERIGDLKRRHESKSYVILVSNIDMLNEYVQSIHPRLETLLMHHNRPLTIIYNNPVGLPKEVMADDGSAAIRVVKDAFCQAMIEKFKKPIVSTSANVSGEPYPSDFGKISSEIIGGVDYVVKHRRKDRTVAEPSVIARMAENEELEIIRG